MIPKINGFDVYVRLREMTNIPIIMLSACTKESDLLHGFNLGVDDFVKKPFVVKEFQARVQALLRRSNNHSKNEVSSVSKYKDDVLMIDLEIKLAEMDGKLLKLSSTEYDLLACLVRNMGKIVSHNQLMQEVWGSSYGNTESNLTIYIYYLRKKLEDSRHDHQYIHTHWGRGYMFLPRED